MMDWMVSSWPEANHCVLSLQQKKLLHVDHMPASKLRGGGESGNRPSILPDAMLQRLICKDWYRQVQVGQATRNLTERHCRGAGGGCQGAVAHLGSLIRGGMSISKCLLGIGKGPVFLG